MGFSSGDAPLAFKPPDSPLAEQLLRDRWRAGRRPGEAGHHARQVVAAIEPVLELAQVSLRVLALHGVVGAPKRRLDVADDGVQPDEFLDANGSLPAAGYDRGVQANGISLN